MKRRTRSDRPAKQARAPRTGPPESDETFAFIAGYTDGGAPYGIRWDKMDAGEDDAPRRRPAGGVVLPPGWRDEDDLPF